MKALIKVGYACNDHCGFCHTLAVREVQGSAAEVHAKIERAKALGHSMVVLSGGEPTIRPELFEWAAHVASLGMDFGLVTNGRVLSYSHVVERLLAHRLKYVYLSLHGGSAKVHNRMVRSQAFDETHGSLRHLSGRGIDLSVNCVITRHNVEHLREIVDATLPYEDAFVKFSMVEPKGGGDVLFRNLMPRVAEVAEKVLDALRYADARLKGRPGARYAHGALPLCLLPGYEDRFDDLKTHRFATMVEVGETDFFPVDDLNKLQPESSCRGCSLSGPCPGLYRGYHEVYGAGELRPQRDRLRPSSYEYGFVRVVGAVGDPERCPLRDGDLGISPWDLGRHLFVRNRDRVGLFRADSRDFSDHEMIHLKNELGQIYFDLPRKEATEDRVGERIQLRRAEICEGCGSRDHCTGLFEPLLEDVFSRDDAAIGAWLRGLEGDVLDVGCGDAPYQEALEPAARSGALRYVGVDPDADRLAALGRRWEWADLRLGSAEALPIADERFDHVLFLRSWNRLRDPAAAIAAVVSRMRPEATLTIVDSVAFGLARSATARRRAEGSTSVASEPFRNDDAEAAEASVEGHGLELVHRIDVGPGTSHQWVLRYRYCAASPHG